MVVLTSRRYGPDLSAIRYTQLLAAFLFWIHHLLLSLGGASTLSKIVTTYQADSKITISYHIKD